MGPTWGAILFVRTALRLQYLFQDLCFSSSPFRKESLPYYLTPKDEIFVLQCQNAGLGDGVLHGAFSPKIRCATSMSVRRHLSSVRDVDARLLFDSAPAVVCLWASASAEVAEGDNLTWQQFIRKFPLPPSWSERLLRIRRGVV